MASRLLHEVFGGYDRSAGQDCLLWLGGRRLCRDFGGLQGGVVDLEEWGYRFCFEFLMGVLGVGFRLRRMRCRILRALSTSFMHVENEVATRNRSCAPVVGQLRYEVYLTLVSQHGYAWGRPHCRDDSCRIKRLPSPR